MTSIPIYVNEQSSYLGIIPSGFKSGQMISIKVQIQGFKSRCNINLSKGPKSQDDTMLHVSIRPFDNVVVRNIYHNGKWHEEERHGIGCGCPVGVNVVFEIKIFAEDEYYKIAFNGQHYCNFDHRLALQDVRFLSINGDCIVHQINYHK